MNIFFLLVFFAGCFFVIYLERKSVIPFLKWCFIVPFCFILANRSIKVPDTEAYYDYFYDADSSSIDDFSHSSFEIGFQFFSKLIKLIVGDNFTFYLAIIVLLNLLIIDFATKRVSYLFRIEQENNNKKECFIGRNRFFINSYFSILPLTLYVAYFGIYLNAIVLRVGIAISLFVLATSYALKEKRTVFDTIIIISLFILGYFFHSTAVFGFLIMFVLFSNFMFSKKTYLFIWLLIGIIYFTNFSTWLANGVFSFMLTLNDLTVLATKLESYDGNVTHEIQGISMKFMFFWIMSFFLIYYSINSKIYFKYLNVYLIGLLIFGLFRSILLIERVTDYFLLFSFICFYLFLIMQRPFKFWLYFIPITFCQLIFILRITN